MLASATSSGRAYSEASKVTWTDRLGGRPGQLGSHPVGIGEVPRARAP